MRLRAIPLAAVLALGGCPKAPPEGDGRNPPPLERSYAGDADGLHAIWADILAASQHDERERVHHLMASFTMTDEDLDAVFGVEQARFLRPRYLSMIATLVNIGSMELVARITERAYDDVEVVPVAERGTDADRAALRAMHVSGPVFHVRVKRKGEARGLLYPLFFYRNGHWVTANDLGRYFAPTPDGGVRGDGGH